MMDFAPYYHNGQRLYELVAVVPNADGRSYMLRDSVSGHTRTHNLESLARLTPVHVVEEK